MSASLPSLFCLSIQMKLEGKVRRLLGDEFQEKVSLVSLSLLTTPFTFIIVCTNSLTFSSVIFVLNECVLCL